MADAFEMEKQPQNSNWCWAAVGVSVNRYFLPDSPLEMCDLAGQILNDPDTCKVPPSGLDKTGHLENVLRYLGLLKEPPELGALDFDNIRAQINASLPVCVRIEWSDQVSGHFVVISGFARSASGDLWVDVADPYYENATVLYDEFVHAYLGDGEWNYTFLVQQP